MKKLIVLITALLVSATASSLAAEVKANWDKQCANCHGPDGKGDTKMGKKSGVKDYTDPKMQSELKDDRAFKNLKEGMKEDGKVKMKAFASVLSDDEIKELIKHIRGFKK